MKLVTKAIENKLIKNFKESEIKEKDHFPVCKVFGGAACTWLLSEYDPENRIFFGLCDLGFGETEMGYVGRDELEKLRFPPFGSRVERDLYFQGEKPLSEYAKEAREKGRIVS